MNKIPFRRYGVKGIFTDEDGERQTYTEYHQPDPDGGSGYAAAARGRMKFDWEMDMVFIFAEVPLYWDSDDDEYYPEDGYVLEYIGD